MEDDYKMEWKGEEEQGKLKKALKELGRLNQFG